MFKLKIINPRWTSFCLLKKDTLMLKTVISFFEETFLVGNSRCINCREGMNQHLLLEPRKPHDHIGKFTQHVEIGAMYQWQRGNELIPFVRTSETPSPYGEVHVAR